MGPLDQVVVAHDVLLAGYGLVVSQKVDAVHVAIIEVPAGVVEGLGDAVAESPGRRHFKPGLAPQCSQADRIVTARVVPIDIEDFHGVAQLIVIARGMVTVPDFLEPESKSPVRVGHARRDGRRDDFFDAAEVVAAVGEPRVDHVNVADVLQPNRPVRFPGLEEGPFPRYPAAHGRPAIPAIHRAALEDRILVCPAGQGCDLLDV
ncbi:MAG: hypothetical protein WBC05_02970 [Sedimentisphaerales bacterium]